MIANYTFQLPVEGDLGIRTNRDREYEIVRLWLIQLNLSNWEACDK